MFSRLRWRLAQFLELHWWKRYLRQKQPAEYLANKRAYWQRVLRQIDHQPVSGQQVLDAGCGPAGIFILLADNQQVTALDPLLKRYGQELDIFQSADYPGVVFVGDSIEASILQAASFDVIYCFNAINHVADWEKAFDQLTHWIKPGGRLVVSSDVHRRAWLLPVFRTLPGDALHPQQHPASDYRNALVKRGWTIIREDLLRRAWIFDYVCWTAEKTG